MESNRRNFSILQKDQIDCENNGKHNKSHKEYFQSRENENKKKRLVSKMTQVNLEAWLSDSELSNDIPTETFWKVMAEKRRVALDEALKENERLWVLYNTLTKDNAHTRQLLDEANSFIEVFKEVVQDSADDTGIDISDISLVNGDERQ